MYDAWLDFDVENEVKASRHEDGRMPSELNNGTTASLSVRRDGIGEPAQREF